MLIIDKSKFDEQRFYLLTHRIKETKGNIELSENNWQLKGRRYDDDERIAYMLCGYLVDETRDQNGEYNYKAANAKLLSMDTNQIDPYIKKAVIESAEADYYYTYEKEW